MSEIKIDPTLYRGRPADAAARLEKEIACYDLLDQLGIAYDRVDHAAADTIDACAIVEQYLGAEICKNLFLCNRQKTDFYLLLMPGKKPFKTKVLSHQINTARLSFAGAEDMERLLHITPGSVSVLGLMHDRAGQVRLLIDRDLLTAERFGCHPCINTSTLNIATADVLEKLLPAMAHSPTFVDLPWETD